MSQLQVHNTRTHRLEPYESREPGHTRMYVCGPSVYDEAHLGHARSYVAYDAIKRTLKALGWRVTHVQNFTDVEESIPIKAAQHRMSPMQWATRLIERFHEDMDALHVQRADKYPRVSEHIPDVIRIIGALEDKRVAYTVDCGPRPHQANTACDVYFSVKKAPDFGQLIGETVEELTVERPLVAGARRNPLDFALWKSRDDLGITWPSPWGEGRPGWHVECTAMATKYLGYDFDIHGGGLDLVFPHHESERAIGEAVSGQRYCNYYLHNGFVTVGEQKMSKSLGNFVTVKDLLAQHDAEVIRAFLLETHYRAPLNYDAGGIAATQKRVERWRAHLAQVMRNAHGHAPSEALAQPVCNARDAFWAALRDDFHTDRALDALDNALAAASALHGADAAAALAFLREAARATGLLWELGEE